MDPDATLQRIFDLLAEKDYEECWYACIDLEEWFNKDGFLPQAYSYTPLGVSRDEYTAFLHVLKQQCKRMTKPTGIEGIEK